MRVRLSFWDVSTCAHSSCGYEIVYPSPVAARPITMDDVPGPPKRPAPIPATGLIFTSHNPGPADSNAVPAESEPAWQRTTFTSLADAEPFLNQLTAEQHEHQLVVHSPDQFVVEWR
jgi:hypothetical protein